MSYFTSQNGKEFKSKTNINCTLKSYILSFSYPLQLCGIEDHSPLPEGPWSIFCDISTFWSKHIESVLAIWFF